MSDASSPDPLTGRTIRRLTTGGINICPYFNSWAWTPESDWVFHFTLHEQEALVMATEVTTGQQKTLAGPFPLSASASFLPWAALNALPVGRGVTFVIDDTVWRAELDGHRAEKVADLPVPGLGVSDSDVTADGQWHVMPCIRWSKTVWEEFLHAGWPPDEFFARHKLTTLIVRVNLSSGTVQTLWEEPAVVTHISVCPTDSDLILFCHEGEIPARRGRMFLRRADEKESRPVRDQRSGRVRVTHERWFADGRHIAYHGSYLDADGKKRQRDYVGVFDVERDLPHEYVFPDIKQRAWHTSPSPDGRRLVMDQAAGGAPGLFLLTLDSAGGQCHPELLTSLHTPADEMPRHNQWRELDPIWSPDGRHVLFRVAQAGNIDLYTVEVPPA